MSEQMTICLRESVSRSENAFIGRRLSSYPYCRLGGRDSVLFAEGVFVERCRRSSKSAPGSVQLTSTALRLQSLQPRKPLNSLSAEARKRWRPKTCFSSVAAGPSQSEENPLASSNSEEGPPMRKLSFTARLQRAVRQILSVLQKFSPDSLFKALVGRILEQGMRHILLCGMMGCAMGLVYMGSTLSVKASPQLVPYSELVDHLQSRTVTTALFEDGSNYVFFNVERKDDSAAAAKSPGGARTASRTRELFASMPLVSEGVRGPMAEKDGDVSGIKASSSNALHAASKDLSQNWAYSTRRVKNDEAFLLPLMRDAGVIFSSAPQSISSSLRVVLVTVLTLWIPLSPLLWLLHRQMSQSSSSTRKKRNVVRVVKFEDVAGVDLAKAELIEIVDCLKGAAKFASLGAKVPKGVLLVGPPGTGKTLLARAVAGEARVPFFAASASEFVEMFVGRGAARIRELFSEARKTTPSIVFIDELDAVGGRRGRSFNDERDQTLNQLLTEMDGFESDSGILVLAATNRPEALDPALYRPGRLSRRVHVSKPDLCGRQQVLALHMRGINMGEDPVLLQRLVASLTGGFVGADLANLVNEAALLAARKGRSAVMFDDFKEAIDRVKYGVRDRRRSIFNDVEQKFESWLNNLSPDANYPLLPSSG